MKNIINYKILAVGLVLLSPLLSFAQSINGRNDLSAFGARIVTFINNVLVPAAFAVVLLLFVYGIFRLFILSDSESDEKKQARQFVLWAVISMVVVVSIWGIVSLISQGLDLEEKNIDDIIPVAGVVKTN